MTKEKQKWHDIYNPELSDNQKKMIEDYKTAVDTVDIIERQMTEQFRSTIVDLLEHVTTWDGNFGYARKFIDKNVPPRTTTCIELNNIIDGYKQWLYNMSYVKGAKPEDYWK